MNVRRATEIICGIDETIHLLTGFCCDYQTTGDEIGASSALLYLTDYKKFLKLAIQNAELNIGEEE